MTLLSQGAHIERRDKASPKSKSETQDVYYLVWDEPVDNAGLMLTCERRMWRGTFFQLLEDNKLLPMVFDRKIYDDSEGPTRWVLNK